MERIRVLLSTMRAPQLRLLVGGYLGFALTEAATWVAILVYAQNRGGATETGLVALTQLLPPAFVAPFAGFASDRFSRDRVLVLASGIQAVALAAVALAMSTGADGVVVYGLGALATCSMTFHRPIVWALFPWVVSRPEQLTAANVAGSFAESLGLLLGPALAAGLLVVSGPAMVFGVMSGVMVLIAIMSGRLQVVREVQSQPQLMTMWSVVEEAFSGYRVLRSGRSRSVVALLTAGFVLLGAADVAAIILADEILGSTEGTAGLLSAAVGVGAVMGSSISVLIVGRRRLVMPLAAGAIVSGAALAATGTTSSLAIMLLLFGVNGVGAQALDVVGRTIIQRSSTDDVLARVFAVLESLTVASMAVGAALLGWLSSEVGPRNAIAAIGLALPALVLLLARRLIIADRSIEPPNPILIDALLDVPMFEPLATPVIEQLAFNMVSQSFDAGEVVIHAGEVGSLFYLIETGQLEVQRGGEVVVLCGPGEHFGEVALLRNQRRNATVRAVTPARVWEIERDVFLEAVTGHPQSRHRSHQVASERGG